VRPPSELVITTGSLPSMTATTLLVVPKSMPIILLILLLLIFSFVFVKKAGGNRPAFLLDSSAFAFANASSAQV
jgi:hypothetical protein